MIILLVDDDMNDAQLIREILIRKDPDITILDAESCDDALRMASTVDAIVMDEKLVRTSGSECVVRLRENGYIGAFILLTGFPDTKIAVDAMMGGADNYLSKNDAAEGLYPALTKALEKRRKLRDVQYAADTLTDVRNIKTSIAALEVKVESNNAKQFEMLLKVAAAQDADRRWRFRQWLILLGGIVTMLGKMFKDYVEAVYK